MSEQTHDLTVRVSSDTSKATQGLSTLNMTIGQLSKGVMLGNIATQAFNTAWGFLSGEVSKSIAAWNESERTLAQTNAVLESTRHAAGLSAEEIVKLSQKFQGLTTYSDEAVLSVENLLLTFTNITGPTFETATAAVLDMATALGTDTKSAAIQLGKALQDPIQGVNALTRVGVNFSERQKEVIEQMVKTGKTMDAQKLILAELSTEFGGSATAAAKTFEGQMKQLENKLNDVEEGIGHGLTSALSNVLVAFNQTTQGMQGTADVGKIVFQVLSTIAEFAANAAAGIHALAGAFIYLGSYVVQATSILQWFGMATDESFSNFRDATMEGVSSTTEFALNLHNQNEKTLADWDKITAASGKFATTGPKAYEETAKAAKEAADKIKQVNEDITKTSQKLADLIEERDQQVADTRKAIAEEYVAQEQRIADLRKQLLSTTDAAEQVSINNQITQNLNALTQKKQLETQYSTEITEARRRASETEFERNLEDIARKADQDTKAFEKKRQAIYAEMALNLQKLRTLSGYEQQATDIAATEGQKRTAHVTSEVNTQIEAYNRLAQARANAYASSASSIGSFVNPNANFFTTANSTLPHFEMGGTINAPRGTEVPIIAHGGETIIPAERSGNLGGGNVVNITINNPKVTSNDDLDQLKRQIEQVMRPLLLNAKVTYV